MPFYGKDLWLWEAISIISAQWLYDYFLLTTSLSNVYENVVFKEIWYFNSATLPNTK